MTGVTEGREVGQLWMLSCKPLPFWVIVSQTTMAQLWNNWNPANPTGMLAEGSWTGYLLLKIEYLLGSTDIFWKPECIFSLRKLCMNWKVVGPGAGMRDGGWGGMCDLLRVLLTGYWGLFPYTWPPPCLDLGPGLCTFQLAWLSTPTPTNMVLTRLWTNFLHFCLG